MKVDEEKIKFKKLKKFWRQLAYGLVLVSIVGVLTVPMALKPAPVNASPAVFTFDEATWSAIMKEAARRQFWDRLQKQLKTAAAVAFKNSLHFFLNTLAYDTATWIASGGEGQQPLFHSEGWGAYLADVADGAAGTFLEGIGDDFLGVNLCDPGSLQLKISLGLAIADTQRPRQPRCTATELIQNYENFVDDFDFLERISVVFDSKQNDVGISLAFFSKYYQATADEAMNAVLDRQEGEGFKGLTEGISDLIKTPGSLIRENMVSTVEGSGKAETTFTGEILADAVDTFTATLAGKLMQRLFREGLGALAGSGRSSGSKSRPNLFNPDGGSNSTGVAAAQERFLTFLDSGIITGGPYEVLVKLASCSEPNNPGPEECVIDQRLRLAIEQELTVRQAIDQGYLNGNAPLGYIEQDVQPHYQEGYPYRSLLIMRAHRIIPVGWEIAAEIANNFKSDDLPVTLNKLINEFDVCGQTANVPASPFCGLIDESWVLKAPEHICKAEGPGPILLSDQFSNGQRRVQRADYCADYQSCIDEDGDGNCQYFGYCVEERSTWNLQAESCEPAYNTCTTYQDDNGQLVSYLANTLDYNGCSADNAGCQWYCTQYNFVSNEWTCQYEAETVLAACTNAAGCAVSASCSVALGETTCVDTSTTPSTRLTLTQACNEGSQYWDGTANCAIDPADATCVIPNGGVSCQRSGCEALPDLLANGSFEIASGDTSGLGLAQGWTEGTTPSLTYFERVSGATEKILSGSNSLRFFSFGGSVANGPQGSNRVSSGPLALPNGDYTFSAWVYNRLNLGTITVEVNGVSRESTLKNGWQQLLFNFTSSSNTAQVFITVNDDSSGQVNGIAWFDDFRISQSCVANPIRLTLSGTSSIDESKIHFDRDVQTCDPEADGCSAFIRTQPNSGTNLVRNASLTEWPNPLAAPPGWTGSGLEFSTSSPFDASSLLISNSPSQPELQTEPILGMKQETSYRVSVFVKASQEILANQTSWEFLLIGDTGTTSLAVDGENNIAIGTNWQRVVFDPVATGLGLNFRIGFANPSTGDSRQLYIDGLQVEEVVTDNPVATAFKPYGAANIVHLKKAPDVLNCTGNFLVDPDECNNYALYCQPEEVGCESYRPAQGGIPIPGVAGLQDYCPLECVGYDTFKQTTTYFENVEATNYFIPKTARQCNASQVGCDEFTNLDEVALGGEGREYYKYLRQCELPEDANCQPYFTWQGSEDTGYQLRSHSLVSTNGVPDEAIPYNNDPDVAWPESWCSDTSVGLNGRPVCCDESADTFSNPFCKEYIDLTGGLSYRIEPNTIKCSEDCHPFRKTRYGESNVEAENNCISSNGEWDGTACIYKAIPSEGVACAPAAAGCREYRGNSGGNIFTTFSDDFEDGENSGWRYGEINNEALSVAGKSLSSELLSSGSSFNQMVSTMVGTLPGGVACTNNPTIIPVCGPGVTVDCYDPALDSCLAADTSTPNNETCYVRNGETACGIINSRLNPDKEYIINFWAKADLNAISGIEVELVSASGAVIDITGSGAAIFGTDWNYYTFGPFSDSNLNGSSRLRIRTADSATPGRFFVDNIEIREIQKHAYVIKNSWVTPASCDTNPFGPSPIPAEQFMLGCKQYRDSGNRVHNLKQFTNLCREEAVGCEVAIDTQNSNSPFEAVFNANDPLSDVKVPADSLVYIVNQTKYQCASDFEGCQAVGVPNVQLNDSDQETVIGYQNLFLINDPDDYDTTLCNDEEVGCEEYRTDNGLAYFKNPGSRLCDLRYVPSKGRSAWFRSSSSGVDDLTQLCPTVQPPVGELRPGYSGICSDSPAPPAQPLTCTSTDVSGCANPATATCIKQDHFVGSCPAGQNSCNLFIDPVSNTAKNLLFNGDFTQQLDSIPAPDGWTAAGGNTLTQQVTLKQFTTYTLSIEASSAALDNTELLVSIGACTTANLLPSYDRSMIATATGLTIPRSAYSDDTRTATTINGLPDVREYSGRFSLSGDAACTVSLELPGATSIDDINALLNKVELKETILDYALANTVDKHSCNGQVNPGQGCVLFNDRSGVNYKLGEDDTTYLLFDADVSAQNVNSGAPVPNCSGACDTNAVLRVKPDRECEQWLSCSTIETETQPDGTVIERCLNLVACDELNEDGTCASTSNIEQAANRTYTSPGGVEQLRNLSGYAKAGTKGSGFTSDGGYYPYQSMEQLGESAIVANGNFESTFGETSQPLAWTTVLNNSYLPWEDFRANVGKDPALFKEGTGYLNLNSVYQLESDYIDVFGGSTYTISGWINTLDLFPAPEGNATIMFKEFTPAGISVNPSATACESTANCNDYGSELFQDWASLRLTAGRPWVFVSQTFKTAPQTGRIKIRLVNRSGPAAPESLAGTARYDAISISTVLKAADPNLFINRTCRLYPSDDAPSCTFINDNSQVFVGWEGFCLTRDPNNPESCLQWWPVEQLKGDQVNEIAYDGATPLYICSEGTPGERIYEYRRAFWHLDSCKVGDHPKCPPGYYEVKGDEVGNCGSFIDSDPEYRYYCIPLNNTDPKAKYNTGKPEHVPVQLDGSLDSPLLAQCPEPFRCQDASGVFSNACDPNAPHNPQCAVGSSCAWSCLRGVDQEADWSNYDETNQALITSKNDGWYPYDGVQHGIGSGTLTEEQNIQNASGRRWRADGWYDGSWGPSDPGIINGGFEKYKMALDCRTVVNVVSAVGNNKAWSARIHEGSSYTLPELGFSYQTPNKPFGSMLPPNPVIDPMSWPQLPSFKTANEANAGVPYICVSDNGLFSPDCHPDAIVYDYNDLDVPYPSAGLNQTYDFARSEMRMIFAQSNNIFRWSSFNNSGTCNQTLRVCSLAPSRPCSADVDCQASDGYSALNDSSLGWSVPQVQCPNNIRYDVVTLIDEDFDTVPFVLYSGPNLLEGGINDPVPTSYPTGWGFGNQGSLTCGTNNSCGPNNLCSPSIVGRSSDTPDGNGFSLQFSNQLCSADWDIVSPIMELEAQASVNISFEGKSNLPVNPLDPPESRPRIYIALIRDESPGDFNPSDPANIGQTYLNMYDTWRSYTYTISPVPADGNYRLSISSLASTDGLVFNIDNIVITSAAAGGGADNYCAVAPVIRDIYVNNTSTARVIVNNTGNVNLQFNVDIDENQLPLTSYRVDWGDNTATSYSGVNLRSRSNTAHSFSLNHFYDYWQLRSQATQITANPDLQKNALAIPIRCGVEAGSNRNYCDVDIIIQARDNWGWCSGNLNEQGAPPAANRWGYYSGNNSYRFNFTQYIAQDCLASPATCDQNNPPFNQYLDGPRYDCDDFDARTRYLPSQGFNGAIRVYEN